MTGIAQSSEDVVGKFLAAWEVFGSTCGKFIAPEPTYQAWFSHYLISQFGIDRVAREPMIKKDGFTDKEQGFAETNWWKEVDGGHVRLDVVVMREPGVHLPHYANRWYKAEDGSGLERLEGMAIISELKVTATQGLGQGAAAVARDVYKLSMLLQELERQSPIRRGRAAIVPHAIVCVLDNHPRKRFGDGALKARLEQLPHDPRVRIEIMDLPEHQRAPRPSRSN